MKKISSLLLFIILSVNVMADKFRVDANYLVFYQPGDTSYIELQYLIYGNGLIYKQKDNGEYQGKVNVNITFKSKTDGKTIDKKYSFITASYKDSTAGNKGNNYNLSRIPLPSDSYEMYICINDENNATGKPLCFMSNLDLNFSRTKIMSSDIMRIGAYSQSDNKGQKIFDKNGLTIIPYFSNFYPEEVNNLAFMQEIYNTDIVVKSKEKCKMTACITGYEKNDCLPWKKIKYFKAADKYVFFYDFDIDSLPSGNYYLITKVFDPEDKLLIEDSMFFQRSNPKIDILKTSPISDTLSRDSLLLFIKYLNPIAHMDEVKFIRTVKKKDFKSMSDFFTAFWIKRNPDDPWGAWFQYYGNVMRVNNNFSTLKLKGYATDRGFYYLKYGAPSDIEYYPMEEGLFPYEIWRYYRLADQVDVYFIFGNLDLTTKDYTMICSNKKDEIYDPRWKLRLMPRTSRPANVDETE